MYKMNIQQILTILNIIYIIYIYIYIYYNKI